MFYLERGQNVDSNGIISEERELENGKNITQKKLSEVSTPTDVGGSPGSCNPGYQGVTRRAAMRGQKKEQGETWNP